jgi:hypothetical protein
MAHVYLLAQTGQRLLWAAVMLFELGGVIRNRLKCPELFPPKAKIRIHGFAFTLELCEAFFLVVIFARHGQARAAPAGRAGVASPVHGYYTEGMTRTKIAMGCASVLLLNLGSSTENPGDGGPPKSFAFSAVPVRNPG